MRKGWKVRISQSNGRFIKGCMRRQYVDQQAIQGKNAKFNKLNKQKGKELADCSINKEVNSALGILAVHRLLYFCVVNRIRIAYDAIDAHIESVHDTCNSTPLLILIRFYLAKIHNKTNYDHKHHDRDAVTNQS